MAAQPPRRRSKLVGTHPAEQHEEPLTQRHEPADRPPPASSAVDSPKVPVTRNPRRLRTLGRVTDDDMVSFNCKMSRGLRREVRHFATDAEVDIQDVVAAALAEYLTSRGVDVPRSELRQPD